MLRELLTRPTIRSALALASARRLLRDVNSQRQTTKFIAERGFRQHPCTQLRRNFYDAGSRLSDSGPTLRQQDGFPKSTSACKLRPVFNVRHNGCRRVGVVALGASIACRSGERNRLSCRKCCARPIVLTAGDRSLFPGSGQVALWCFSRKWLARGAGGRFAKTAYSGTDKWENVGAIGSLGGVHSGLVRLRVAWRRRPRWAGC